MNNKYITVAALAISLLYVDLFCGAGGTSTGVETAKIEGEKCAKVIACVNHDPNAIASHAENHPESLHYTEDIRTLKLSPLAKYAAQKKKEYPFAKLVLWASLECTNFSKAKGGQARDADSRTLAEHLDRYIIALNPDSVQIENVEEFMSWGDLDENGRPISRDKGKLYTKWVDHIKNFGYNFDYRILNSADFGALTSRKRFFAQFNKPEFPIVWPEATHAKNPEGGFFGSLEKWRPVKEVLDFSNKGKSIFNCVKSDNTFKRILEGLKKEGKNYFLTSYYGNGKSHSVDTSIGTITTKDRYALHYIQYDYSSLTTSSILNPAGAVTTIPKHNLMTIVWMMDTQFNRTSISVNNACPTIIARQDKKPLYILQAERGYPKHFIKDSDSEIVKELKEFMIRNYIKDIFMRMLTIQELKEIMGFPKGYVLIGTQADQKKFIGNAVEVTMARKICEASAGRLLEKRKAA